jgi:hypothetical protein
MSTAGHPSTETGPSPDPGADIFLEGVAGGPWESVLIARSGALITVSAPRRGGQFAGPDAGRRITLCYSVRGVPCELGAVWVEGPIEMGGEAVAVVRALGGPRRIQRRGAVRVPVTIVARARPANSGALEPGGIAAITENLSAGGTLLRMREPVEVGDEIAVTIHVPASGDEPMEILGRVVRCDRAPTGNRDWRVALAFDRITAEHERALVGLVFRLQHEQRGRETGMGG